jgi:hypothetical protein
LAKLTFEAGGLAKQAENLFGGGDIVLRGVAEQHHIIGIHRYRRDHTPWVQLLQDAEVVGAFHKSTKGVDGECEARDGAKSAGPAHR